MSTRAAAALAIGFALVVGFLTWRVIGERGQHCYWAVTVGTHEMGYDEVPCDSSSVRGVLDPPTPASQR